MDPSYGETKDFTVTYEFRGQRHVFTVPEEGAVSYAILAGHALHEVNTIKIPLLWDPLKEAHLIEGSMNPTEPPPPAATDADSTPRPDIKIIAAYYGIGDAFSDVTATLAGLFKPAGPPVDINPSTMRVNPSAKWGNDLIVTYEYLGQRRNFVYPDPEQINYAILIQNATANDQASDHSPDPPSWLANAHPKPPGEFPPIGAFLPLDAAIEDLAKAQMEIQQAGIGGADQLLAKAMAGTQLALANVQAGIAFSERKPIPPMPDFDTLVKDALPASPGIATRPKPDQTTRINYAIAALNTALSEIKGADSGDTGDYLPKAIAAAQQARIDAMNAVTPSAPPAPLPAMP